MKNNKILLIILLAFAGLGLVAYFINSKSTEVPIVSNPVASSTSVVYSNTDFGFTFSLPDTWKGYTIVSNNWEGNPLTATATKQTGSKLLIRNPKWTAATPYEDLPILVFTIQQWNAYLAEDFSVSAAPIQASELGRNNKYVFALPPRWDFDYSLDYKEAEDIIASKPLHAFNVGASQTKLNINVVCEHATSYMKFTDAKSLEVFVADCKDGKHPEVIEKYKADMNLGDGATI